MDNPEANTPVATTDRPFTALKLDSIRKLDFKYFPAYAQFILDNKLKEFASTILQLCREMKLPLLRLFQSYSEEELRAFNVEMTKRTLGFFAANKTKDYIEDSLGLWMKNEIPRVSSDAIGAEDIALFAFIRRKAFREFLHFYTNDIETFTKIMEEIDRFTAINESASFNVLLDRQHNLYRQAQSLARIGNWVWDLKANKLIWSDELYRIYELEPGTDITNQEIAAYNHPDDKEFVKEQMRLSAELRIAHDFYYRIVLKDGREKSLHAKGQAITDEDDRVVQFFGTLQDVTEQKQSEKELKEQQNFIQKIAHLTPSLIAAYNVHTGRYIFINNALRKLLGYEPDEILNKDIDFFSSLIHPDDLQPLMEKNAQALAIANERRFTDDNEVIVEFQYRLRNKSGEYRWFHTYGTVFNRNHKGEVEHVINISVDVTDQYLLSKQLAQEKLIAERRTEELRRSEERYHQMIAEVEDYAILLLDKDGIIRNWNKGAERIKGYKAEEIIGQSFHTFYTKEDLANNRPIRLLKQAVETGKATDEGWRVRKDGTKFWGSITITALHDQNNEVIGFTKLTRDLTERKNAEDKLYEYAKQLEAKNEELRRTNKELESFNYVASHDLQEPLRKIQVFSNAILSSELNSLSDKGRDYFSRMNNAANRMRRLIEDLLAFSRATVLNAELEYCDLNLILDEVLATLKISIDEAHAVVRSSKLPFAYIIPFQFKQVLQNLISNSIKYRKADVQPQIDISAERVTEKRKNDNGKKEYIKLTLSDNGIGFEHQHAEKIFELFQRLHTKEEYPGTGIGLAICKKIIQNHNGIIRAKGKPGVGATFEIYLPEAKE